MGSRSIKETPVMEEILSSIRQIVSDDFQEDTNQLAPGSAGVPKEEEDILELTDVIQSSDENSQMNENIKSRPAPNLADIQSKLNVKDSSLSSLENPILENPASEHGINKKNTSEKNESEKNEGEKNEGEKNEGEKNENEESDKTFLAAAFDLNEPSVDDIEQLGDLSAIDLDFDEELSKAAAVDDIDFGDIPPAKAPLPPTAEEALMESSAAQSVSSSFASLGALKVNNKQKVETVDQLITSLLRPLLKKLAEREFTLNS